MTWSFRNKVLALVTALTLLSAIALSSFFLKLYKDDKVLTLLQNEKHEIQRTADTLHSLVNVAEVIQLSRVGDSRQIVLAAEGICDRNRAPSVVVSQIYREELKLLQIDPQSFVNSLETFLACKRIIAGIDEKGAKTPEVQIVPFNVTLMFPYLGLVINQEPLSRLVLLSLEQFEMSPGSSFFLVDPAGRQLWAADAPDFESELLADTGTGEGILATVPDRIRANGTGVELATEDGLISYARLSSAWDVVSISYLPMVTHAVSYAFQQFIFVTIAVLCLAILLARMMARAVAKPIEDLRVSAEAIGAGRLDFRFEVKGSDEFSVLKRAFNVMAERINHLIGESKAKAALESDIAVTRDVQHLLFPKSQLDLQSARVSGNIEFCDQCGGDWWGYIETQNEKGEAVSIVMVGDVTGHGTPSALMTASIRGAVAVLERWIKENRALASDPGGILRVLNAALFDSSKGSINMTFFVSIFNAARGVLKCANAGHPPPTLISAKGADGTRSIRSLAGGSVALGSAPDGDWGAGEEHPWTNGTKLVLYTDGLIDCQKEDKNLFDRKALRKTLTELQELSARNLMNRLLEKRAKAILDLPKVDDVTLVVCESAR